MIIRLCQVAGHANKYDRDIYIAFGGADTSVGSGRALEERGLVYAPDKKLPGLYKLTEAGELVLGLLKLSGLVQRVESANGPLKGEAA